MTIIRCFCVETGNFVNVDVSDIVGLDIEHDALMALDRIRHGDRDFIFEYENVSYPLDDTQTLALIATWQQPDPVIVAA